MKTKIFKRMMACLLCVVMLSAGVQVASAAPGGCTCTTKCFEHTINMECSFCAHGQWMDCFGVLDIPEYTGDGTIDAASGSMQSADLMKTLIGALDKFDKITVILPSNAGEDAFNAIRTALNWATKPGGSVDLTILGATAIPTRAFESCDALGAFSAPQAESLGEFAFLVCLNLRTIHLPQVSSIGQYAFQNCNDLRTLTLGNVTSVNHGGFGIFHGVSSVNQIDLRLGHDQKELTKNGNYWQPTGNTLDTTSNSFVGYTFRSISTHYNAVLACTANGSTITATCDCGYSGTATLSAPEGVAYDGTEKKIATVEYSDGWQSGELAVTYTNHINIGTATASITFGGVTASVNFDIDKAPQTAPTVSKTDETIACKADGKITGLTTQMEYRKDGESTYTAVSGDTLENLAAGKYFVRFKEDEIHYASAETQVVIAAGRKLAVTYKADGAIVATVEVAYGEDAAAPALPSKEGYTPTWDNDGKNITADTEINAIYTINEYTITFMDENGVYKTLTYKHGETVTMPEVPAKDGYTVKWETTIDKAVGNVIVNAVYTRNAVSDNPQTGDNSNIAFWIALLFFSGVALITLTVVDRRRRTVNY